MNKIYTIIVLVVMGALNMHMRSDEIQRAAIPASRLNNPIKVQYTNYRGETAVRTIVPLSFEFGRTDYHPHEQWLVKVWDVDRNAERLYALKDISKWFVE